MQPKRLHRPRLPRYSLHRLHIALTGPSPSPMTLRPAPSSTSPSIPTPSASTPTSPLSYLHDTTFDNSGLDLDYYANPAPSFSSACTRNQCPGQQASSGAATPPRGDTHRGDTHRPVIRRQKSHLELEIEEERNLFGHHLVDALIEPRPSAGLLVGGIEEVLSGRV